MREFIEDWREWSTMKIRAGRTAVLMGAGASADAGLPLTNALAVKLLEAVAGSEKSDSPMLKLLNFVYGAMVNHRTESGGDPFAAVNVETMISAIRLLRERAWHEAAPFVEDWKRGVSAFSENDGWYGSGPGQELIQAIASQIGETFPDGTRAADAVRAIVSETTDQSYNSSLYAALEKALLVSTRRILLDHDDVSYFTPLLELARAQPDGLDVATLNYDLTLEHAAAQAGVQVEVPFDWSLGLARPSVGDPVLRLFKIHGSIDWEWSRSDTPARTLPSETIIRNDDSSRDFAPAIVIGDRDKLGTEGPTLAVMASFASALERADRLVVVGYAFGDPHVNRMVRDWVNRDAGRVMTVLDPSWPTTDTYVGGLKGDLNKYLVERTDDGLTPRMNVIRGTAGSELGRALNERPVLEPTPRFDTRVSLEEEQAEIWLVNKGSALIRVAVRVPFNGHRRGPQVVEPVSLEVVSPFSREDAHVVGQYIVDSIDAGATVHLRMVFASAEDARRAEIVILGDEGVTRFEDQYIVADNGAEMRLVPQRERRW